MILEFWSVGDIEIISLLDKEFMDEYILKHLGLQSQNFQHSSLG